MLILPHILRAVAEALRVNDFKAYRLIQPQLPPLGQQFFPARRGGQPKALQLEFSEGDENQIQHALNRIRDTTGATTAYAGYQVGFLASQWEKGSTS